MQLVLDAGSTRAAIISCLVFAASFFSPASYPAKLSEIAYDNQLNCLALNIYQEARGEPTQGRMAVAAVTMNRVKSKHYPNTICEVVWQPKQFSWTSLKLKYHTPTNAKAWKKALALAKLFIDGASWSGVGKATHFHAISVTPNWMDTQRLVARYGNHLFYTL